jgi:CO dehydrogenase nickel-insertion accessory protein CooC1
LIPSKTSNFSIKKALKLQISTPKTSKSYLVNEGTKVTDMLVGEAAEQTGGCVCSTYKLQSFREVMNLI